MAQPRRHLVIPDCQVKKGVPTDHMAWIGQAVKEAEWLPRLGPHLPLAVPEPVAVGLPDFGYPWPWTVARWLPGSAATSLSGSVAAARTLAGFLSTLQSRPLPSVPGSLAGRPLASRDEVTRAAIADLAGVFDAAALTRVWEAALDAPPWDRPPVWFHGDFHTGNLRPAGPPRLRRVRCPHRGPDHPPDHRRPGRHPFRTRPGHGPSGFPTLNCSVGVNPGRAAAIARVSGGFVERRRTGIEPA